jgi:Family of unknown function (DUF5677)
MAKPSHSAEAEEESLKLVEDFVDELSGALNSLGGVKPVMIVDTYRFRSAKHLHRAVAGFAFLRRPGLVDSSKFLVRPALEMAFKLQAVRLHPEMFFRIAHEERRQDRHLMQGQPELQEESDKNWERFKAAFAKDYPAIPIPNLCDRCDRLSIARVAEKAEMKPYYDSHYRIYSRYTHGALQASAGNIDEVTNPADNPTMAICGLVALDNLISFGAKSANHDTLVERLERVSLR